MQPSERQGIIDNAVRKALGGGLAGTAAQVVQVGSLMWLHTTLNYQYKHGVHFRSAIRSLWKEGGVPRFYRGLGFALMLAPASRFVDTAANAGCLALLSEHPATANMPVAVQTACGSVVASVARLALLPLDVVKTVLQVEGLQGWPLLRRKLRAVGGGALFHGALASTTSSIISHYPWFLVYNWLDSALPEYPKTHQTVARNAAIGLSASTAAAFASNWTRVIKTAKQTQEANASYLQLAAKVVREDGLLSLLTRGLGTKIMISGIQSMVFTVMWKVGQNVLAEKLEPSSHKSDEAFEDVEEIRRSCESD